MSNSNGLLAIIVGAPGCGKTTLSPFISNIIRVAEENNINAERMNEIIDDFLVEYPTESLENSIDILHRVFYRAGITLHNKFIHDTDKITETGDLPNYHNWRGEVNRSLTPVANAYCFSRVLLQQANVIITGTGMSMYRFLPLLNLQPARAVKVIIPQKELKGYYPGALTNSVKVRTGQGGFNHKRFVSEAVLSELYTLQERFLDDGGFWEQVSNLKTFSVLANIISTYWSPLPQHEITLIKYHLNNFLAHNID
ncbi:hypothetical protein [Pantoea ananatis]